MVVDIDSAARVIVDENGNLKKLKELDDATALALHSVELDGKASARCAWTRRRRATNRVASFSASPKSIVRVLA